MIRENTAAEFRLSDPILALGEIGVETDTGKSKIGNGVTRWNLLQYSNITTAARHNLLQARLDQILGRGAGQSGYGQGIANYGPPLTSYQVSNLSESNLNSISAVDINSLYADMLRVRVHQIGTVPTEIAQIVAELNTIAETTSSFVGNNGIFTPDPEGSKKGIVDYETLMNKIELDKFQVHPSQVTLESAVSSTRNSPWNGIIFHEFTVSFINADHRRHFFNSGGEIRMTSSITGAVSSKGQDWAAFMSSVGTVRMNYNSTTNTNNSGGSSIGNYNLTGLYQVIYQKSSQGTVSAIYAGNIYKISARSVGTDSIQFKVEYNDVSTGSFVDVNVTGILENSVQLYRADSVYVSVPKPTTVTGIGLTTFATPQMIYSLSASSPGVAEGGTVTINLTTVNVPNGTLVPYNIQGVSSADISGALLDGNFQVVNNNASMIINIATNNAIDSKTLTVRLANGSSNVSVNIIDNTPVYSLSASSLSVTEGSSVDFNLTTANVSNGTLVPYTISGVSSTDINIPLTGSFTVSNNQAQVSVTFTLDQVAEPTEQFNLSLNNGKGSITVNVINNIAQIFTSAYNSLRSRINAVMVLDYGQTLNSIANINSEVPVAQWNNLYTDMIRARTHQTNSFTQQALWLSNYTITQADLTYLSELMTTIENNNRVLDTVNQASISTIATSSRATGWNTTIDHEFTVTFASAAARTYFFNAGGQIRLNGSVTYTGADPKTLDWKSLLSGMGNIIMNHTQTVSSAGFGIGSSIGNIDLTATYQLLYERTAATYAANNYRVFSRADSTNVLRFLIQFNDAATGNVDENVQGTIISNGVTVTPDGTVSIGGTSYNTVVLATPTGTNTNTL